MGVTQTQRSPIRESEGSCAGGLGDSISDPPASEAGPHAGLGKMRNAKGKERALTAE